MAAAMTQLWLWGLTVCLVAALVAAGEEEYYLVHPLPDPHSGLDPQCPPGRELLFDGNETLCQVCSAGRFDNGTQCTPCPAGMYSSLGGRTSCHTCDDGAVSFGGSTECVLCPSGTVAGPFHSACQECEAGKWSISGDTKCRLCELGTYNAVPGKPGCVECGKGYYNPNAGSFSRLACQPCPSGFACPDDITGKPIACGEFQYSASGSKTCRSCPDLFRSDEAHASCQPTGPFYGLVGAAGVVLLLFLACLLRCPTKHWSRPGGLEGLALITEDEDEDEPVSDPDDDLYDDDEGEYSYPQSLGVHRRR